MEPIRRLDSVWASPGRVSGKIRRRDWCARHLLNTTNSSFLLIICLLLFDCEETSEIRNLAAVRSRKSRGTEIELLHPACGHLDVNPDAWMETFDWTEVVRRAIDHLLRDQQPL